MLGTVQILELSMRSTPCSVLSFLFHTFVFTQAIQVSSHGCALVAAATVALACVLMLSAYSAASSTDFPMCRHSKHMSTMAVTARVDAFMGSWPNRGLIRPRACAPAPRSRRSFAGHPAGLWCLIAFVFQAAPIIDLLDRRIREAR